MSEEQQKAIVRERHALALEMRKFGYSFDQIAEHFETTPNAARGLVKTAMENLIREPGEEVLQMELERLDQLYRAALNHVASGDSDAIPKCLAIMNRRAKYLGLDAPSKQEVTGPNGNPLSLLNLSGLTDEELATVKALVQKAATDPPPA